MTWAIVMACAAVAALAIIGYRIQINLIERILTQERMDRVGQAWPSRPPERLAQMSAAQWRGQQLAAQVTAALARIAQERRAKEARHETWNLIRKIMSR